MFTDNQACLALCKDDCHHERSKHIDIRYHFARNCHLAGTVAVQYCPTQDMIADVLTKPVRVVILCRLNVYLLGMW